MTRNGQGIGKLSAIGYFDQKITLTQVSATMKQKFSLNDIRRALNADITVVGDDRKRYFTNVRPILDANKHSLTWISPRKTRKDYLLKTTKAEMIVCNSTVEFPAELLDKKCFIVVDNPRLTFMRIVTELFSERLNFGIHPTAIIHPDAKIHNNVYVGPYTHIGKCNISENCEIKTHVVIEDNVSINRNVIIDSGSVIGSHGFGFARNDEGAFEKFPHIGSVVIEDNVEIGTNALVAKGVLGDTVIKKGSKLSHMVYVGANSVIGRHCAIGMRAIVSGSVVVNDFVWISPGATIRNAITVGANSIIGLGAVVVKDVSDNQVLVGNPAKVLRINHEMHASPF